MAEEVRVAMMVEVFTGLIVGAILGFVSSKLLERRRRSIKEWDSKWEEALEKRLRAQSPPWPPIIIEGLPDEPPPKAPASSSGRSSSRSGGRHNDDVPDSPGSGDADGSCNSGPTGSSSGGDGGGE